MSLKLALVATFVSGLALTQGCNHGCDRLDESYEGKQIVPDTKTSAGDIVTNIEKKQGVDAYWAGYEEEDAYDLHFPKVPFDGNEPLTLWVTMDQPVFYEGHSWDEEYGECFAQEVEAHATLHVRSKSGRLDEKVRCDLTIFNGELRLQGSVDALHGTASSYKPKLPAKGRPFVNFTAIMSPGGYLESLEVTMIVEVNGSSWNYRPLLKG
jgi:hypothetical protein